MFKNKIDRQFTQIEVDTLTNHSYPNSPQINHENILQWRMHKDFSPYEIRCHLNELGYTIEQPIWTFLSRMGQTKTLLPDGTKIFIAGEYEDFYDPDFKIYNDVVSQKPSGEMQLWNYPIEQFPATDFHSATYDSKTHSIFIVGNIGYSNFRKNNVTKVYQLDLDTMRIKEIECLGLMPSWLNHQIAEFITDDIIEFSKGITIQHGQFIRNLYKWQLNIRTFTWSFPDQKKYSHWNIFLEDLRQELPLYECRSLLWDEDDPEKLIQTKIDTIESLGYLPNYQVYKDLYRPGLDSFTVQDEEDTNLYTCTLAGHTFVYLDCLETIEVIFSESTDENFQQFILEDLKVKLKKMTGHDVITERFA